MFHPKLSLIKINIDHRGRNSEENVERKWLDTISKRVIESLFWEEQFRRDKHDVRFQFVRTSSSNPRNNSVFTVIDACARPTASILSRDVSLQSILVPLTPSRLMIALYSQVEIVTFEKFVFASRGKMISSKSWNEYVQYEKFYILSRDKLNGKMESKVLFPSFDNLFLVIILNSGGKWLNRECKMYSDFCIFAVDVIYVL